jgi:hypothetical protein
LPINAAQRCAVLVLAVLKSKCFSAVLAPTAAAGKFHPKANKGGVSAASTPHALTLGAMKMVCALAFGVV